MTDMLLVYVTCDTADQAKQIGRHLMKKKLCACVNIFPEMQPLFFWPPKSGTIDESHEVAMIVKTTETKYVSLAAEIEAIHPHDTPCIIAIPCKYVGKKYYSWLTSEME